MHGNGRYFCQRCDQGDDHQIAVPHFHRGRCAANSEDDQADLGVAGEIRFPAAGMGTGLVSSDAPSGQKGRAPISTKMHIIGTSGTVTVVASMQLGLKRYRRSLVDGMWLDVADARRISKDLCSMSNIERAQEPCIGHDRADLVVCGCAILEAILRECPSERIRVADRGLREGILADLAREAKAARSKKRRSKL